MRLNMIVDGKGQLFENRRKKSYDRRADEKDTSGGRRKVERRIAPPQVPDRFAKKKTDKD